MTAHITARSVYARALISAGMTESGQLLVMAEALRAAERRKSKSFREMVEDVLDHLEGKGIALPMADALRDVRIKNDPRPVVEEHLHGIDKVAELVFQEDDTFLHATKKANRERMAALMAALSNAKDDDGPANVKAFPATALPVDDIDEASGLTEAGRLAAELRKGIGNGAAAKLETFIKDAEGSRKRAEERAARVVDDFLGGRDGVAQIVREVLVGTFRGPELGRKPIFVRHKGPPHMSAFNACVSKIDDRWATAVSSFKTADIMPKLPDGYSLTAVHSDSLPEAALPRLGFWDRVKLRARSAGVQAGPVLVALGSVAAFYLGFDTSSLSMSTLLAFLKSNAGFAAGIGTALVGGVWAPWSAWSGAQARLELERFVVGKMKERRADLIALLMKPFDECVEATVETHEATLKSEIEPEVAILARVEKTASELGFKAKARAKSGPAEQAGQARRRA